MAPDNQRGCPELETFIVSKYDPLLTIVKELNENLQHLERGISLVQMNILM